MQLVIKSFGDEVSQLKEEEDETEADVGGKKQQTKKEKKLPTCRTLIDAVRLAPVTFEPPAEIPIASLGDTVDMFQLRWYTLFVLYSSEEFRNMLCRGSPQSVCEKILRPFITYLDLFLFGETGKQGKLHSAILTPAELVPRFMVDLRNAYF